jgi:hypothetical protein
MEKREGKEGREGEGGSDSETDVKYFFSPSKFPRAACHASRRVE